MSALSSAEGPDSALYSRWHSGRVSDPVQGFRAGLKPGDHTQCHVRSGGNGAGFRASYIRGQGSHATRVQTVCRHAGEVPAAKRRRDKEPEKGTGREERRSQRPRVLRIDRAIAHHPPGWRRDDPERAAGRFAADRIPGLVRQSCVGNTRY